MPIRIIMTRLATQSYRFNTPQFGPRKGLLSRFPFAANLSGKKD